MNISRNVLASIVVLLGTFATCQPSNVRAQSNTDIGKNAFQTTVHVDVNNFVFTPVTIPSGKRLVVKNLNLSGAATTTGPYVQPVVIVASELDTAGYNYDYFGPNASTADPTQYYASYPTAIYADKLQVGPAFAGYTPTFMSFNVVINGYLVDVITTGAPANASQPDQGPDVNLLGNRSVTVH